MRIRIVKTPPAYVIDGFDVRGMHADHDYDVDARMGRYLVIAGFAARLDDALSAPEPSQTDASEPSRSS